MRRSFVSDCGGGSNRLLKLLAQAKSSKLVALVSVGLPLLLLLVASHQPVDCARVAANLPASGNGGGGVAAQQVANSQPTSQQQASNAAAAASQISTSGAQLFQSPAALAAIAAAAAAQQANLPVQHPPPPPPAAAAAAMVPMAAQQVSAPAIASNMLSPSLPAAITGRVDTAELLKQAAQQLQVSSQQQQASLNIETGKSIARNELIHPLPLIPFSFNQSPSQQKEQARDQKAAQSILLSLRQSHKCSKATTCYGRCSVSCISIVNVANINGRDNKEAVADATTVSQTELNLH